MPNPERINRGPEEVSKALKANLVLSPKSSANFSKESEDKLRLPQIAKTPRDKLREKVRDFQIKSLGQVKQAVDPAKRMKRVLAPAVSKKLSILNKQFLTRTNKGIVALRSTNGVDGEEALGKLPGFVYDREFDKGGGTLKSGLQFLDSRLLIGTMLNLSPSKLPDGVLSPSMERTSIDAMFGAKFNYEVKGYGQLFEVRGGVTSNGTRTLRIETNINPVSLEKPHFVVEFSAGFNPKVEIEPGKSVKNVKTFGVMGTFKFPTGGLVPMLSLGATQTTGKVDSSTVSERSFNMNLNIPFGKGADLSLYGSLSEQRRPSGYLGFGQNRRGKPGVQQSFNAGAMFTVKFN